MDTLQKNRTSLVIAHRLSIIEKTDEILVIEDGRIMERGQHAELFGQKGAYPNFIICSSVSNDKNASGPVICVINEHRFVIYCKDPKGKIPHIVDKPHYFDGGVATTAYSGKDEWSFENDCS